MAIVERGMRGSWEWDDQPDVEDTALIVIMICKRIFDPYRMPFTLLLGENDSGRAVWWAVGRVDRTQLVYTGEEKFNRWSGRGSDDWEEAADDAELCLRRLGFRQEKE